jgi:hypothetical protein
MKAEPKIHRASACRDLFLCRERFPEVVLARKGLQFQL